MIHGMEVRTSSFLVDKVQFRFPRSKKKRMRKKWARQEKNYHFVPSNSIWTIGGSIYVHPQVLNRMRSMEGAIGDSLRKVIRL